jgi:hypothetical protein
MVGDMLSSFQIYFVAEEEQSASSYSMVAMVSWGNNVRGISISQLRIMLLSPLGQRGRLYLERVNVA